MNILNNPSENLRYYIKARSCNIASVAHEYLFAALSSLGYQIEYVQTNSVVVPTYPNLKPCVVHREINYEQYLDLYEQI